MDNLLEGPDTTELVPRNRRAVLFRIIFAVDWITPLVALGHEMTGVEQKLQINCISKSEVLGEGWGEIKKMYFFLRIFAVVLDNNQFAFM